MEQVGGGERRDRIWKIKRRSRGGKEGGRVRKQPGAAAACADLGREERRKGKREK